MKCLIALIPFVILSTLIAFGQYTTSKELVYIDIVTKPSAYLHLMNDSMLSSSIIAFNGPTKYSFKQDSIFILSSYSLMNLNGPETYVEKWKSYKILFHNNDSLILQTNYKRPSDSLLKKYNFFFTNIDHLKETITSFKYLKFSFTGYYNDKLKVWIDSSGKIILETTSGLRQKTKSKKSIRGTLSEIEFRQFLDTLSYAMPSQLPEKRHCGSHPSYSNFEISFNNKTVTSKGCYLFWAQEHFLFNYLMNLEKNKRFTNRIEK